MSGKTLMLAVASAIAALAIPSGVRAAPPALTVPDGFNGVAIVHQADRVLLDQAFGDAGGRLIRRGDKFWVASVGKQFAAAAVLKLVEQGRLRLDAPIGGILPDVPADKAAITVRQLLAHTSGLGQSYVSERQSDRATAVRAMLAEPLQGVPGDKFRYSNSNIQLAAAIIEVVSGKTYAEFAKVNLWAPAGLRATGLAGSPGAAGVLPIKGELPPRLRRSYWGEQGVYSTAPDLVRWYRALASGRVLKPESVQLMFAPAAKTGEGHATLGWFRGTTGRGNDVVYVRGNEDFGANALLYAYPKSDTVIVVLTHAGDAQDASWSRTVLNSLQAQLGL